jgi:hypothetical protein
MTQQSCADIRHAACSAACRCAVGSHPVSCRPCMAAPSPQQTARPRYHPVALQWHVLGNQCGGPSARTGLLLRVLGGALHLAGGVAHGEDDGRLVAVAHDLEHLRLEQPPGAGQADQHRGLDLAARPVAALSAPWPRLMRRRCAFRPRRMRPRSCGWCAGHGAPSQGRPCPAQAALLRACTGVSGHR